jgi:hypothetical protein
VARDAPEVRIGTQELRIEVETRLRDGETHCFLDKPVVELDIGTRHGMGTSQK